VGRKFMLVRQVNRSSSRPLPVAGSTDGLVLPPSEHGLPPSLAANLALEVAEDATDLALVHAAAETDLAPVLDDVRRAAVARDGADRKGVGREERGEDRRVLGRQQPCAERRKAGERREDERVIELDLRRTAGSCSLARARASGRKRDAPDPTRARRRPSCGYHGRRPRA